MAKFEAVVVGGGPGGYECAIRLAQYGIKTALIEENKDEGLGGTCLNRGCIPAKTLLMSSDLYKEMKECATFGVSCDNIAYDYKAVKERKCNVSKTLRNGIAGLCKSHGVEIIYARAVLTDAHTLSLSNGDTVEADKIVLATGSQPARIPIPGIDLPGVVDSTGLLDLEECPKKVVIVGGGVIGIEFATHFTNLGVEVTILEMLDTILAPLDADISSAMAAKLEKNGAVIKTGVRVTGIAEGLKVTYAAKDGSESTVDADIVLMAGGRRPNSRDIGLEKVGVATTRRGHVETDGLCRTNVPGIYAIGDLNGKMELAHAASAQGLQVAAHIAGKPCKAVDLNKIPSCVYTSPEAAMVGMTEKKAAESGRDYEVSIFGMSGNGKAMVMGQNEGMVKLITDKATGEILGAHLLAPRATDMISEFVTLMAAEGTVDELAAAVHPHPTVSEALMEAAHVVHGNCVHAPKPRKKK